jgi:hypothetical protein
MEETRNACRILVQEHIKKHPFRRLRWEDVIKMDSGN